MLTDAQYLRLIASMNGTTGAGEALDSLDRATRPALCSSCGARASIADVGIECERCHAGTIENQKETA